MLKSQNHESWQKRIRAVASIIKLGLPQFIGFELLFRFIGIVVFTPLNAWLTARLIAWSGSGAISNYDIASFFLSAKGLIYLTSVVSIGSTLLFFEFGGLVALSIGLQRQRKVTLPQLFHFLLTSLPRLWRLAVRQFLVYLAYAIPALAVTGAAYLVFLTKNDINYYLLAKPPQFWLTVGVGAVSGITFAFFAIRRFIDWIHSVPLLLFTEFSPAEALRESSLLVAGRRWEILFMLLRCLTAFLVLWLIFVIVMIVLKTTLFYLAGDKVGLVLGMTAVLAVIHLIGLGFVGILVMSIFACAESRIFLRVYPAARLPETFSNLEYAILRKNTKFLRVGWVLLLIFVGLVTYVSIRMTNTAQPDKAVTITAHRGSSITAPENTMAAILLAVEEGADFVEIDVQETKDGTVVLVHDKDLKRVFDIDKGIWEMTYDELRGLDSGGWFSPDFSDQRLATLDQVIRAVKGKAKLNIELKFNGHQQKLASEVIRIVRENDFAEQCILTSLDYAGLRRAAAAGPELRTGVIVTSALGDITKLETDLLSVSAGAVTRDLIDRAQRSGLEIHVWTVNDIPLMNTMIGMGVDSIITDNPSLLGKVLLERSKLSNTEKALLQLADIANQRF